MDLAVKKENADPAALPRPQIDLTGDQPDDTNDGDVERFVVPFTNTAFDEAVEMGRPIDVEKFASFKTIQDSNEVIVFFLLSLIGMCPTVSGVRPGINGVKPVFCSPFIV